jgi:hypothetical protein
MDLGSLFFLLSFLILIALFIGRPLYGRRNPPSSTLPAFDLAGKGQQEISFLLAERDRVLNSLQELDFDYSMGKIPEEDYPAQRAFLLQRGVEVLRRLDILQGVGQEAVTPDEAWIEDDEARLEAAIAARRGLAQASGTAVAPNGHRSRTGEADDALEVLIASRRRERHEKAAGFCPQCGGSVQRSDIFCPKCGTKLKSIT